MRPNHISIGSPFATMAGIALDTPIGGMAGVCRGGPTAFLPSLRQQ